MRPQYAIQLTALLLVMLLILSPPWVIAQQYREEPRETPFVKMSIDLVSLNVTVMDKKRRAILGLNKEDFKVFENRIKQTASFFSTDERPVSWGLVLDRSGSMREMIKSVYQAGLHVVDEDTAQDDMFIMTFSDQLEVVCNFTTDGHKQENSIAGLRTGGQTALYDAVSFALDHIQNGKHQKKVLVIVTDGEDNSSRIKFRELICRQVAQHQKVVLKTLG
ncbi:MAG: VWA domain-containing protein [Acidobacteriota bacterium]